MILIFHFSYLHLSRFYNECCLFLFHIFFCQYKVDLAFDALKHITEWEYDETPIGEAAIPSHKGEDYFLRGKAIHKDFKIEYLLRKNSQCPQLMLHNIVVLNGDEKK